MYLWEVSPVEQRSVDRGCGIWHPQAVFSLMLWIITTLFRPVVRDIAHVMNTQAQDMESTAGPEQERIMIRDKE